MEIGHKHLWLRVFTSGVYQRLVRCFVPSKNVFLDFDPVLKVTQSRGGTSFSWDQLRKPKNEAEDLLKKMVFLMCYFFEILFFFIQLKNFHAAF